VSILSIQSNVLSGHVGNAAACLPLHRLGYEVWPLDTVVLSNHPALTPPTGRRQRPDELIELIDGLAARGLFGSCSGLLSGYLGDAENGSAVTYAADAIKSENPDALIFCDPVMGDNGKIYVNGDILGFYKDNLVKKADIIAPNAFEAGLLVDGEVNSRDQAISAIQHLRNQNPSIVILTGVERANGVELENFIGFADGVWSVTTPKIEVLSHGAGDLLSALFVGRYLATENALTSFRDAVSGVFATLQYAASHDCEDLPVVAAQEEFLNPKQRFDPGPV